MTLHMLLISKDACGDILKESQHLMVASPYLKDDFWPRLHGGRISGHEYNQCVRVS